MQNPWGFTPLFMGTDTPDIVRILVEAGVDLNEKCGERGEAAIHLAAVIGSCDTVKLLLDKGADINIRTDHNETALWLAVWKGHVSVCRLLLQRNCTLGVPSNGCQVYAHDYTELELAMGLDHFSIAKMLVMAGHPLANHIYYGANDNGPLDEIYWVKLREETLRTMQTKQEEFKWFCDFVSSPRSLKCQCTLLLRQILLSPLEDKIRKLNIPSDVVDYICFKHQTY